MVKDLVLLQTTLIRMVNDPLKRFLHHKMLKSASKYLKIPAEVMKIRCFSLWMVEKSQDSKWAV
jgi:hypothetical protein